MLGEMESSGLLPGRHDVCLRQVTLSVVGVQNSGGQVHGGFCRDHSPRPEHTSTPVRPTSGGGVG